MGADIHVKILERNNNTWKQVTLYHKEKEEFKIVNVYPFRNYELFDILNGKEDDNYIAYPIREDSLPVTLKKEIEGYKNTVGYYGFKEINLADLKLYLYRSPKIRDYDYEENSPNAWKTNPVKYFIEKIEQYINFASQYGEFVSPPSDIRIIYWFDC